MIYKLIEKVHFKLGSYSCWHGIYGTWITTVDDDKIYTEYEERDPSCWICNTWRGKVYLYFYLKSDYLLEVQ